MRTYTYTRTVNGTEKSGAIEAATTQAALSEALGNDVYSWRENEDGTAVVQNGNGTMTVWVKPV